MSTIREATVYLIASPKGYSGLSVRTTANSPRVASDEIVMSVNVRLPAALFSKPALRATIEVPIEAVSRPQIDAVVIDNIREQLTRTLGVDLTIAVIEPGPTV